MTMTVERRSGAIGVKLIRQLDVGKGRLRVVVFPFMGSCLLLSLVTAVVLNRVADMPEAVLGFT